MRRWTSTPWSGSFDSAVAGLDKDECVTAAVLEGKYEVEETVRNTSDGLDSMLSWKDRDQMAMDEESRARKQRRTGY